MSTYYPKDFIKNTLIEEVKSIGSEHAYLSFILLCSGIEFLGRCCDTSDTSWATNKPNGYHFKKGLNLFPSHYSRIKTKLYKELRCGMTHGLMPGGFKLTEQKNDPGGNLKYESHLKSDQSIIVWEFLYKDFVNACKKVISTKFSGGDKMNKPFLYVGSVAMIN